MRVLLIDNDELNLLLAHEVFEQAGVQAVAVRSLDEVRQALGGKAFDCVFLDPGFNGLHSCRLLDELRGLRELAALPFVALLAHAESAEWEQCLLAGISQFVQKPLSLTQVEEILAQLFPQPSAAPQGGWQTWGEGESAIRFPRGEAVNIGQALKRFGGNTGILGRILNRFHADQRGAAAALYQVLREGDIPTAERLAHSLKGAAGNIDAIPLAEASQAVEFALKNGDSARAETLMPPLEQALKDVFAALDQWKEGESGPAPAQPEPAAAQPLPPQQALALLEELKEPLERRRPVDCEPALRKITTAEWPAELRAQIAELEAAIQRYRFRPAQELLGRIIQQLKNGTP